MAALAVVACSQPQDRLLSGGKPVKDLKVIVNEQPAGDMLLRTVSFVNTGFDAVQVDAMETSWVSVEGGETWTFQPSSSSERLDWAFPVEDGFHLWFVDDPDDVWHMNKQALCMEFAFNHEFVVSTDKSELEQLKSYAEANIAMLESLRTASSE